MRTYRGSAVGDRDCLRAEPRGGAARVSAARLTAVARPFRDHAPLLIYVWAYAAIGSQVIGPRWLGILPIPHAALWQASLLIALFTALVHGSRSVLREDGVRYVLSRKAWAGYRMGSERFVGGLIALTLFAPIMGTFSQLKDAIPGFHPFRFDPAFAAIDRTLHFGVDPWRLTAWVPAWGTALIDDAYYLAWAGANLLLFAWVCWSPRSPERTQYLTAFALTWTLLGTALAVALSSAGPVYFDRLTGSDDYAPLFDRLSAIDGLWTMEVREYLWHSYATGQPGEYSGITAMPSMHVASAMLVWLGARQMHRVARWLAGALFGVVLFGSVHLGWHYAIDGYVSILCVAAIWWVSGHFARWWIVTPPAPTSPLAGSAGSP